MTLKATLLGLGILALVVLAIIAGVAGINAWEQRNADEE